MIDVEHRTACRRLLARVAAGDPAVFRRRASSATAAAAICWIGKDNDLFQPGGHRILVKDLMSHFGLAQGSVSQRAETLLRVAGFDPSARRCDLRLGSPEPLVSTRRRRIIELRDRYFDTD